MTNGHGPPHDASDTPGPSADAAAVGEIIDASIGLARERGRDDLAERLDQLAARVRRTETIVCVVGEFKKGKSALINALLGSDVCPVDDDLATTAVTVVRHAAAPAAVVRRRDGAELVVEPIDAAEIDRWVAEVEGEAGPRGVEVVEVGLPNAFLERGLALVDTPGVGGLNAAHAAATLAFLPSADALVFVTDASAELSEPELAFLASARECRPADPRRGHQGGHLSRMAADPRHRRGPPRGHGCRRTPYPLSSVVRAAARDLGDPRLETESGFPPFAEALVEDAVGRARAATLATASAQLLPVLDQLREPLAAEAAALEHPRRPNGSPAIWAISATGWRR